MLIVAITFLLVAGRGRVAVDAPEDEQAQLRTVGDALGTAAIVSFFAGCVSTLVIAALAVPLTKVGLLFGPPEYFALMVLGALGTVFPLRGAAAVLMLICLSAIGPLVFVAARRAGAGLAFRTPWPNPSSGPVSFVLDLPRAADVAVDGPQHARRSPGLRTSRRRDPG
mgnify:CR=1 FL=1